MTSKQVYKEIAKNHGVTWQEVRNEMQSALTQAYEDPNRNILNVITQRNVTKKGTVPTPEEFLRYSKNRLAKEFKVKTVD